MSSLTISAIIGLCKLTLMSIRADDSECQPLRSAEVESDTETEQRNSVDQPVSSRRRSRRSGLRPGSVDLTKLDNAFKRLV